MIADSSAHGLRRDGAPIIRAIESRDAAAVAGVARAARFAAIPNLPDLHAAHQDLAYYASQISLECGLVALARMPGVGTRRDDEIIGFTMGRGERGGAPGLPHDPGPAVV